MVDYNPWSSSAGLNYWNQPRAKPPQYVELERGTLYDPVSRSTISVAGTQSQRYLRETASADLLARALGGSLKQLFPQIDPLTGANTARGLQSLTPEHLATLLGHQRRGDYLAPLTGSSGMLATSVASRSAGNGYATPGSLAVGMEQPRTAPEASTLPRAALIGGAALLALLVILGGRKRRRR